MSTSEAGAARNILHPQRKGQLNMLSADDRAGILGEPVAPKSVFDFLSAKDKERLQNLSKGGEAPISVGPAGPEREPEVLRVPTIESRVAQSALKGFMPYGDDLAKQARYKAFLQHHAMPQDTSKPFKPSPIPGKSISELNTELEAFANAAMIFKPMSGMMANRFTSSSSPALLDVKAPEAGLHVPKPVPDAKKIIEQNEQERERKVREEREAADPRRAAVREGNFGPLTRTIEPWYPARLLCKRFNVADPHPEGPPQNGTSDFSFTQNAATQPHSDILSQGAMDSMMQDRKANNTGEGFLSGVSFGTGESGAASPANDASEVVQEDAAQTDDASAFEKPSMDIFKAIFASDDEDDLDEEDNTLPSDNTEGISATVLDDLSQVPDTTIFDAKPAEAPIALTIDNLATFKPTFVSRTDRSSSKEESKKKDKKKKKKMPALVSFDVEDGDEEMATTEDPEPATRKRKNDSKGKEDKASKKDRKEAPVPLDDDEWVEKESTPLQAANGKERSIPTRQLARVKASELF